MKMTPKTHELLQNFFSRRGCHYTQQELCKRVAMMVESSWQEEVINLRERLFIQVNAEMSKGAQHNGEFDIGPRAFSRIALPLFDAVVGGETLDGKWIPAVDRLPYNGQCVWVKYKDETPGRWIYFNRLPGSPVDGLAGAPAFDYWYPKIEDAPPK